jgi:hypothetical protein
VAAALAAHGFSDAELAEGWRLLQRVTRTRLGIVVVISTADPGLITQLDEWENKWFPIADATLRRHAPGVHEWMFRNLSQTEGAAVIVSVGTLVERWESLSKSKDKGGPDEGGADAKKLLEKRGLTKEVIVEAKQLLERAGKVESASENAEGGVDEEDFAQAETDLWAWYREWSTIAQIAIKSPRLLKDLGFRRTSTTKGGTGSVEEGSEDEEEEEPVEGVDAPAAAPAPNAKGASKKGKGG